MPLSYVDEGSGEPVLLLHGIPGSSRSWDAVRPLLGGRRVLIPDLAGFGRSEGAVRGMHANEHAQTVITMMDQARVARAHIVGFDFGGPVAVAIHALSPGHVSALTLLATNVLSDTPVPLPLRLARVPLAGELLFGILFSHIGLAALWWAATADRDAFPLHAFRATIDDGGTRTSKEIFLTSLRRLRELYAPIEAELPNVKVPVTVLWGDRDPFFPLSVGERTASQFQAARWVVVRGAGHFLPHERPREVAEAIIGSHGRG